MKKKSSAPKDNLTYEPVDRKNFGMERLGDDYPPMLTPPDPNKDGFTTMPWPNKDENVDPNPVPPAGAVKSWNETRPKNPSAGKS